MSNSAFFYSLLNKFSIVAITDNSGEIIYVNDNFCGISQYSQEELLGQNHRIIKSGYHPRSFYIDLWKTISSGKTWRGEICNRTKGGAYYWVDTFIIPEIGKDGKPKKYYSLRIDITSRKNQEFEILKQKEELEKIAAIQSHQVRRPVANVIGLIELLDDSNLSESNKELVALLKESASELERTITDIIHKTE